MRYPWIPAKPVRRTRYREGTPRERRPGWDDACPRCSYAPLADFKRCPACLAPRCRCACHRAVQPGLVPCPECGG